MKKIFSTLLLCSLVTPSLVVAHTSPTSHNDKIDKADQKIEQQKVATKKLGFCEQVDKALVYIDTKSATTEEKKVEKITKKDEKVEEVHAQKNNSFDDNDARRKAQFDELIKRATTTEQKVAVAKFIETLNIALLTKKTATEAIIAAHKKEVDQTRITQRNSIDKALTTLKTATEAAKTKAKTDCKNNVSDDIVIKNLKSSIQEAQSVFQNTTKLLTQNIRTEKYGTRKKELQDTEETFKKSVSQSKKDLQASFNQQTHHTSSTTP
jgi:methionine-rich copper-binding protein CopC